MRAQIEKLATVLKKNKTSSYVIEQLATVLKKNKKNKISKGTPGAQVHCHIVLRFCFFCFFSVGSSLLAALLSGMLFFFSRVFTFGCFAV